MGLLKSVDIFYILVTSLFHLKFVSYLQVTVGGARRPVALLQLTSHRGLCALIRLSHLRMIPSELKVSIFQRFGFLFFHLFIVHHLNRKF